MNRWLLKITAILLILPCCQNQGMEKDMEAEPTEVTDSTALESPDLDSISGLVIADHYKLVRSQCTGCHSAQLITQNQASREGWAQMIRWMQETQGLWELGANEALILDYLSEYYGPRRKGRRIPLRNIEWYQLDD